MEELDKLESWYKSFVKEKDIKARAEEREEERETAKQKKHHKLFEEVLAIEFSTSDKDLIVKSLTKLSSYINLWSKEDDCEKYHASALSKFDLGLAMLKAIDPKNPLIKHFSKSINRMTTSKKTTIGVVILFIVGVSFMFFMGYLQKQNII